MNKLKIMDSMSRTFHRAGLTLQKHSPEILVGVGCISMVVSTVLACKATTKVAPVVENSKKKIDGIHMAIEKKENGDGTPYTPEDGKKDLALTYAKTGVELAKLYGPAIGVGALGLTCTLSAFGILHKRNLGLAAAYAAVDTSFKEYRGRVIERFGKELDHELKYNIKSKEVEEIVVDENGEQKVEKKTINIANPGKGSMYARFFDETSDCWEKNAEYNRMFLLQTQQYMNDKLRRQGHLFLNEVHDALGMTRTQYGNVVGWVYNEKHPVGDNYVDFGIFDLYDETKRHFVNGFERSILLDFNVDGNVLELLS